MPSRVCRTDAPEAADIVQSTDFRASISAPNTIFGESVAQLLTLHKLDKVYALFAVERTSYYRQIRIWNVKSDYRKSSSSWAVRREIWAGMRSQGRVRSATPATKTYRRGPGAADLPWAIFGSSLREDD